MRRHVRGRRSGGHYNPDDLFILGASWPFRKREIKKRKKGPTYVHQFE